MKMKTLGTCIASVILLISACNCTGISFTSVKDTPPVSNSDVSREANRQLLSGISARTAHIIHDCEPKEDVIIFGIDNPETARDSWGTGIIVRSYKNKSYIFTAAHVVNLNDSEEEAFKCTIFIKLNKNLNATDNRHVATIVEQSVDRDVAVLAVETNFNINTDLELGTFTGEDVWAAGYPVQLASRSTKRLSITKGTLATLHVPAGSSNTSKYGYYHRITSQVYFGNSGGGVWSKEGKLIGIVVSLYAQNRLPYEGYYYCKPVGEVLGLLKDEWKHWEVFRD